MVRKAIGTIVLTLAVIAAYAQASKIRLNEVMVINTNNYIDRYGDHSAWIELYNSYSATTNVGGCYLSNDPANLKKYQIPKGDLGTKIGPRQHLVFWADDRPSHGTFHLNFKLEGGKENLIIFSDNSGNEVDRIIIPASLGANQSYGRLIDAKPQTGMLDKVTPNTRNVILDDNAANEAFKKGDPTGIGMSITAMTIVFSALIMLYLVFRTLGKLRTNRPKEQTATMPQNSITQVNSAKPEEVYAAIAFAVAQIMNDSHDDESGELTIKRISQISGWSSRVNTLREIPNISHK